MFCGLSDIIAITFILWLVFKYKKAPFLSQAFFKLKNTYLYLSIFIGIGSPIMPASGFNVWFVIAGISLMLVATFPNYKTPWVNVLHSIFAFSAGLFGFIGFTTESGIWWPIVSYLAVAFILYKRSKRPILWIEVLTFAFVLAMKDYLYYCLTF